MTENLMKMLEEKRKKEKKLETFIKFKFDNEHDETEYGEPRIWIDLKSGRSIELCHEEYDIPEEDYFFSVKLLCSDKEFENNDFHCTCGVIDFYSVDKGSELARSLASFLSLHKEKISKTEVEFYRIFSSDKRKEK